MNRKALSSSALSVITLSLLNQILILEPVTAQSSIQGLTIHQKTTASGMMGGGTTNSTMYFGENAIRVSSPDSDVIMLPEEGKYITLNHQNKTYTEMTVKELQALVDEATAGVDKSQMEAMRQMMGGNREVKVTKVGPDGSIAGYPCVKYLVTGAYEHGTLGPLLR